jgi:hypothetical protein
LKEKKRRYEAEVRNLEHSINLFNKMRNNKYEMASKKFNIESKTVFMRVSPVE